MKCLLHRPKSQQGAALIVALLIVFIVASLAVTVSSDFLLMFKRVENQIHGQQAHAYLVGSEGLGRWAVLEDQDREFDHRNEPFLGQPIAFANEIAQFTGELADMQGRLNIANMGSKSCSAGNYELDQQRFIRLLQTLEITNPLDLASATELAHAVFDWMDSDQNECLPGGAETLFYGDETPAGRAADGKMLHISELRWVKGMTAEIYEALLPHVWLAPNNEGININTATVNVLRSINKENDLQPLLASDVQAIVDEQRPDANGYSAVADSPFATMDVNVNELTVKSDNYVLAMKVLIAERQYQLHSLIQRNNDQAKVLARSRNQL